MGNVHGVGGQVQPNEGLQAELCIWGVGFLSKGTAQRHGLIKMLRGWAQGKEEGS